MSSIAAWPIRSRTPRGDRRRSAGLEITDITPPGRRHPDFDARERAPAGIRATAHHRFGYDRLDGVTVAVQGLGDVGSALCPRLKAEGVRLVVADIERGRSNDAMRRFDAAVADPADVRRVRADLFAPCALGAVLDDRIAEERLAHRRHSPARRSRQERKRA